MTVFRNDKFLSTSPDRGLSPVENPVSKLGGVKESETCGGRRHEGCDVGTTVRLMAHTKNVRRGNVRRSAENLAPRIRRYPQWIARLSRGRRANYFACSGGVPAGALHSLRAAAPPSIAQELARLARDTRTRRRSPRGLAHASVSTRRASTGSKKKELLVF